MGGRGKLQPSGESSNLTGEDSTHHFPRLGVGQRPTGLSKGGTCFRLYQCETERAKAGLGEKLPIVAISQTNPK